MLHKFSSYGGVSAIDFVFQYKRNEKKYIYISFHSILYFLDFEKDLIKWADVFYDYMALVTTRSKSILTCT